MGLNSILIADPKENKTDLRWSNLDKKLQPTFISVNLWQDRLTNDQKILLLKKHTQMKRKTSLSSSWQKEKKHSPNNEIVMST